MGNIRIVYHIAYFFHVIRSTERLLETKKPDSDNSHAAGGVPGVPSAVRSGMRANSEECIAFWRMSYIIYKTARLLIYEKDERWQISFAQRKKAGASP